MKKLIFLIFFAVSMASCSVKLVPTKNPGILSKVTQAQADTKNLYTNIMASDDKSYDAFVNQYLIIDTENNNILMLEQARPQGKRVYKFIKDIVSRFAGYEAQHKDAGTINNALALTYQNGMEALWQPLFNAENNYK